MLRVCDKIIEYSFYLLFALVPLILTPWNYELFEFNKMLLTYALTVIIIAAWLTKSNLVKKFIFRRTPLDIPILLFLGSQVVSTIFSIDHHTSFFGYYSRFNGGLLSIISYILLYYAFVSNFTSRQGTIRKERSGKDDPEKTIRDRKKSTIPDRKNSGSKEFRIGEIPDRKNSGSKEFRIGEIPDRIIKIMLFTGALISLYGILEHFGIDANYWVQDVQNRVFSTLGQPNWLAAYLVGLAPLTWGFALQSSKLKAQSSKLNYFRACEKTSFAYFLFSILYLCLLYTKSRSGLLGFGVAFLVFWGLSFLSSRNRRILVRPFLVFSFLLLLLTFLARPSLPSLAVENDEQILITPSSEIRKIVWKGAVEIWRHHPLLGTGPETFAYSYYWHRPQEHNNTSEWDFLYNKAHNEYLNYLATTGIFGLGSYLLIIAVFVSWSIRQRPNPTQIALLAGWLGILVAQFFGFSIVITNLFFFLFPAISFTLAADTKGVNRITPRRCKHTYTLGIIIVLVSSFYFLVSISRFWYSDFLFARGKKHLQSEKTLEAFQFFQKAVVLNPNEPFFRQELATTTALLASVMPELAKFAVQQSDQAISISPYHINYWKNRTKMFYYLGTIDEKYYQEALKTLIRTAEIAPTDAKTHYNLAAIYYYLGEKEKAIEIMEKTVELKPNYQAAKQKLEEWLIEK